MKIAKACKQCRELKRKCTTGGAGQRCSLCAHRDIPCSFTLSGRKGPLKAIVPGSSTVDSGTNGLGDLRTVNVDQPTQIQLTELYLRLIHDKPHTLFHPPSLKRQVRDGSVSQALLFSIMALAARFTDDESIKSRTDSFLLAAKTAFKATMDRIDIENIQASVLIGNLCGAENDANTEALFFGIAFRMAFILRLPDPAVDDDAIAREIKRRVWWTLYMVDSWSAAGISVPRQVHDNDRHTLPMDELAFSSLDPASTDEATAKLGLWAYMIKLAKIFREIHDLLQRQAAAELDHRETEQGTSRLAEQLDRYDRELPTAVTSTVFNLRQHAKHGLGPAFVALHLDYHHYATLLYFHYLDMQLEPTSTKQSFAARCKHHAAAYSDLLRRSREEEGCEAVYMIVAHMTVVSSSALLHALLFGDQAELADIRRRLQSNFNVLIELRSYWPIVSMMMNRLFTFQHMCTWSIDPNTHKVDTWMSKYLLEHALPIGEKGQPEEPPAVRSPRFTERDRFATDALSMLLPLENGSGMTAPG